MIIRAEISTRLWVMLFRTQLSNEKKRLLVQTVQTCPPIYRTLNPNFTTCSVTVLASSIRFNRWWSFQHLPTQPSIYGNMISIYMITKMYCSSWQCKQLTGELLSMAGNAGPNPVSPHNVLKRGETLNWSNKNPRIPINSNSWVKLLLDCSAFHYKRFKYI